MDVVKEYEDGSFLEYDIGKFDDWCVYYTNNEGVRIAPRDKDYFEDLYEFSKKYGKDKIYSDYVKIYDSTKKFIAFTFDDGPGEYTSELLKTLEYNNSSATFFMLGNKMKYNGDIVKQIYNSNSEVASHSYSHKYLTTLSQKELNEEINSTTIIFNEITKGNIKYIRPPYGDYNENIKENIPYPIILWNIDTKDWLTRDSDKISAEVLSNASDGAIVLMHDIYPETLEAVKKVLPKLKELGYEVVSVSKLAEYKNYAIKKGDVIKSIN